MSFDFLLDDTGDIQLDSSNELVLVETIEDSLKQRLGIRVRTDRGEWAFNTLYGIPYTSEIVGNKIAKRDIDTIIQAEALNEDGVDSILDFESEIDVFNRTFKAEFNVETDTGPLSVVIPSQVKQEFTYPAAGQVDFTVSCDLLDLIENTNNLYDLLNTDLPFTGSSTWYDITAFIEDADTLYNLTNFQIPIGNPLTFQQPNLQISDLLDAGGIGYLSQAEYLQALEDAVNNNGFGV